MNTYTKDRPLRVLNLGAGVQSTAVALMIHKRELSPKSSPAAESEIMKFTQELPKVPGAYLMRNTEDTYDHEYSTIVEVVSDPENGLLLKFEDGGYEVVSYYDHCTFCGPLVAPEEVAELRAYSSIQNEAMQSAGRSADELKRTIDDQRIVITRLREEVGKAFKEGFMSTARPVPYDYDNSRAKRVASGEFPF